MVRHTTEGIKIIGFKIITLIPYINVREYRRAIKNGQSREISNIEYTKTQDEDKQNKKLNTICVGHH